MLLEIALLGVINMSFDKIISNNPIPIPLQEKISKIVQNENDILFAIVCDLDINLQFCNSALVVTKEGVNCIESNSNDSFFISFNDITDINIKRLYGNAVLMINGKDVFKFTFKYISFMNSALIAIKKILNGDEKSEAKSVVELEIEKRNNHCSKCGRALVRPGAECLNCISKGKLIKKLSCFIVSYTKPLIICLILAFITTFTALIPPYITKTLVDDVIPKSDNKMLLWLVVLLFSVYLIQAIINTMRSYLLRITQNKIFTNITKEVYRKAQYLPMEFYDKTSTGSMISRISSDTNQLNGFLTTITQDFIIQFLLMVGIMIIMISLNYKLALLSLIPVPIVALGSNYFGKKIQPFYRRIWRRWSLVSGLLSDYIPGIKVVKSFTAEERTIKKFNDYNNEYFKDQKIIAPATCTFPYAVSFLVTCGTLVIWGIGGKWVISGNEEITTGLLVSFISYAAMFYGPINFFANFSDTYQHALTSAERILDILDADPEKDFGKGNIIKGFNGRIEFKNVNFSFDKTKKTLEDINFVIEPGDIVGIVGTTGSGKSTLINLLMRFYDKYDGEILVDGINIKEIDLNCYRNNIGFVQQEPGVFSDTIYNNIAFSNPDASVEEVIHAANIANAHGFICNMPDGYDTVLGERGAGLSGGEKQRISIARAVMGNPSILVFDEATASVDSETEKLIQEAIENLIVGRTTLMIAHRLSTLRRANKIIVVDKGKIIEFGTPQELLELKGKYYKLIQIQNLNKSEEKKDIDELINS